MINGRYTPQHPIGAGGMGEVHLTLDRLTGEQVALKQINLPTNYQLMSRPETSHETNLKLALAHEFQMMAGLRHPHILSVLDYGFDRAGNPFFTMPYLSEAQTFLEAGEPLNEKGKLRLIRQLLQALIYLHRRGIIHRDLKPNNILVTQDETVNPLLKVLDFGLSTSTDDKNKNSSSSGGTPHYLAPEVWLEQPYDAPADIFAVGVLAFQLFTAHPTDPQQSHPFAPLDGFFLDRILEEEPNWVTLTGGENIIHFLRPFLQKDPTDRPTAQTALQQLNQFLGQSVSETAEIRESYLQAATFVGREEELTLLKEKLAQTKAGQGQAVLIGGESGVGKSRLINEVRIRALVEGFVVLRGQSTEGGGLPYNLWRDIARRLLLLVDVTDLQAGILRDIVPDVGTLLGRDIPFAPELTGKAYQERLIHTIVDLLREVQQPLMLLLEDLQWAVEGLTPLKQILLVQEQLPTLMVIGVYRNDEAPTLPETLVGMVSIKLERLGDEAVSALSQAILGKAGQNQALIQLLQNESEGNTFFIVEIMRALAEESGQLAGIGKGHLPDTVFTGGMQQLLRRRLGKIEKQYQELQTLAAVIGRQIDERLLQHFYEPAAIEAWLTQAGEYGVLTIQENQWLFAHDKLREALVADIAQDTKKQLHCTIAETIETVYADNSAYDEALMTHWHEAGNLDKELIYLSSVTKQMIEIQGAYAKAQVLLEQALARLSKQDARAVLLLNFLSYQYNFRGQYTEATFYAEQAYEVSKLVGDDVGLGTSLHYLGTIASHQGEYERAKDLHQQSLTIREKLNDQYGIADSLRNLGIIAYHQTEYEKARNWHQQSLAICRVIGDQRGVANNLNSLGAIAAYRGKSEEAKGWHQQSLAIRRKIDDQRGMADSLANLGVIATQQGEYEKANELHQQSFEIRQKIGDQRGIANNLNSLGVIATRQGNYEKAKALHQQSVVVAQKGGTKFTIAVALSNIGWLELKQGNVFNSIQVLVQGIRLVYTLKARWLSLYYVVSFAGVLIGKEQAIRAGELLGFVKENPLTLSDLQGRIDELMPQLETQLTPKELAKALEEGATLDLDEVVQGLLAEFGEDDG